MKIISRNAQNTIQIAQQFAKLLSKSDVVVLTGELGAGKTKFVEGFLTYFGLQDEISSPTFNIVNEYSLPNISIFHFDVYRLEDEDEFYAIGGEEYFDKGICLIEWGETIKNVLPKEYIHIIIHKDSNDEDKRTLEFESIGNSSKYNKILELLKEELN